MEKVEADLTRSKSLREKQSKEFLWQLEDVKQRYEQQVSLSFSGYQLIFDRHITLFKSSLLIREISVNKNTTTNVFKIFNQV